MATLKGVFPEPKPIRRKNFMHENMKNLRRMEQFSHTQKDAEESQKLRSQRQYQATKKYQNVASKVDSTFRQARLENSTNTTLLRANHNTGGGEPCRLQSQSNSKAFAPMLQKTTYETHNRKGHVAQSNNKDYRIRKNVCESTERNRVEDKNSKTSLDPFLSHEMLRGCNVNTQYRSQGIQTLDAQHMKNLYDEGTIRYPTSRSPTRKSPTHRGMHDKSESEQKTERPMTKNENYPLDRGDISPIRLSPISKSPNFNLGNLPEEETDFIKLNKDSAARKLATQINNSVPASIHRKGVVPKYLRERKEAMLQEEQRAKSEAPDPDCPEGHVPLPDNERKETLRMLKKNYQDFVKELNMMPIKTDTLRAQRRKMEIEKQLNKIEEGIKVFSRPKVYVKVNA